MDRQSLQDLLTAMQGRSITLGWGAVLCFGRSRLNALLEEQFVDRMGRFHQMLPVSGMLNLNLDGTVVATLNSIRVGTPRLSFESASLRNSTVTLTLPLISGSYSLMTQHPGMPALLVSTGELDEQQGFSVTMKLKLAQAVGDIDGSGRIVLDLAQGYDARCNLGSQVPEQEALGEFIMQRMRLQPDNRLRFELGLLDFNSYHPLSPVSFHLATQAAPGDNEGDGGVLVFVRLRANQGNGSAPVDDSDFPYLIPDDRQGQDPRWSASLVIAEELVGWVDEAQLDVLKNLMFPGRSLFVESGPRHRPHDLLILGNIAAGPGTARSEPRLGSIEAGHTQQFVARRADGSVIPNVTWSTESLGSPLALGTITAAGLYTAPDAQTMALDATPALVLGQYSENGQTRQVSASLLGRMAGMSLYPRAMVRAAGTAAIEFRASRLAGGSLRWRLPEPALGSLEDLGGGRARYTPPANIDAPFVLQPIECFVTSGNERIEAAVVISKGAASLPIEPYFVPEIDFGVPIRFYASFPPEWLRWSVQGGGSIDSSGTFITPQGPAASPISLVRCDIVPEGMEQPIASGFSIVRLKAREIAPPRWRFLDKFTVSPAGGLVQAYANGQQQIPLVIEIATKTVNVGGQDIYIKLSPTELATLRLVDAHTGNELKFIAADQEGIAEGDSTDWAVHEKRNRFNLYSPTAAGESREPPVATAANAGTSFRTLYMHMGKEGTHTFFARFTGDDNHVYNSNDPSVNISEIELTGMVLPRKDPIVGPGRDYDIVRERVYNGQGDFEGDDDFTFFLDSVDYWRIAYRRASLYPVPFATLRVEANASTIRWESEQLDETFFSYTGYAFHPFRSDFSGIEQRPTHLTFDTSFHRLLGKVPSSPARELLEAGKEPSPGQLLVSLHRVADMGFWYDGMAEGKPYWMFRALLDGPVTFSLRDVEGNRHRLRVSFPAPSVIDGRNLVTLNIQ